MFGSLLSCAPKELESFQPSETLFTVNLMVFCLHVIKFMNCQQPCHFSAESFSALDSPMLMHDKVILHECDLIFVPLGKQKLVKNDRIELNKRNVSIYSNHILE